MTKLVGMTSPLLINCRRNLFQQPEVVDHIHVSKFLKREILCLVPEAVAVSLQLVLLDTREAAASDLTLGTFVFRLVWAAPASILRTRTHLNSEKINKL